MTQVLWILYSIVIGCFLSIQGSINAQLGQATKIPLFASLTNFSIGTLCLTLPFVFRIIPLPPLSKLQGLPPYIWLGGVLGAIFVTSVIIVIPKLGITLFLGFLILGQLGFSLVIDHYGLFGIKEIAISWQRMLGVLMIAGGAFMVK